MINNKELSALIYLLDDPDEFVFREVKSKLISFGADAIPSLENAWEKNSFGHDFQHRIEDIIHQIQYESVQWNLENWAKSGGRHLLEGVIHVCRYQYPDLNEEKIKSTLQRIKQDIWIELNDGLTAYETIGIFNHIFFEVYGFSGNKKNYHAPQNSYLNDVLESKKGNPLTLSLLYILIAEELQLPIYGVNLPNHFILAYQDNNATLNKLNGVVEENDSVLFYVNPFSRGALLHKNEIHAFLGQLNIKPKEDYFEPCTNTEIVERLINNLIYSYEKLGYTDKVDELMVLLRKIVIA